MFYQKSIVIILLITFFYESNGLKCYKGLQMQNSALRTLGPLTLITCPPKHVCFRGATVANDFVHHNFGCTSSDDPSPSYRRNTCHMDANLFFKCLCNTDGCNRDRMGML